MAIDEKIDRNIHKGNAMNYMGIIRLLQRITVAALTQHWKSCRRQKQIPKSVSIIFSGVVPSRRTI